MQDEARALLRESKTLQAQLDALQKGGSVLTSQQQPSYRTHHLKQHQTHELSPDELLAEVFNVMATSEIEDSQMKDQDISEDDKRDPDLLIALAHLTKSVGAEEQDPSVIEHESKLQSLEQRIKEVKRMAVIHKRNGNLNEAKIELRKARQLQVGNNCNNRNSIKLPYMHISSLRC